jgi:glycosyltransferase involved in cell wall biosynthesis
MNKPLLLFQGPVATRSGYGDHARDLLKSIFAMEKYDVKIAPTRWGDTPQNQIDPNTEFGQRVLSNIVTKLDRQPDVFVQVTVANEFKPMGKYNIGVTAGVETTIAPQEFINGCNKMDLIIVPSEFSKDVLVKSAFKEVDKQTQKEIRVLKLEKPIEVLFEGIDLSVYTGKSKDTTILDSIESDFNFLFVGHWLQGNLGEDRKDIGMMIKTFCTVFKGVQKKHQPGLILKTSSAGFSVIDRENIASKIKEITDTIGKTCPPVYLIFGDLKESDLNDLYNHPKVKSMVMFTKGEGYGRPLAEFCTTGKPIIVSKWSGHVDFLPEDHTVFLDGKLNPIDPSAANQFLIKESQWFTVNYSVAAQKLFEVHKNYKKYLLESNGLQTNIRTNFSLDKMTESFTDIFDKYVPKQPEHIEMKLPEIKKL